MTPRVADLLPAAVRDHVLEAGLRQLTIAFHGGEPLLYRKRLFDRLCDRLRSVFDETDCKLVLALTTNGTLIDEEWAELFDKHSVAISVSVDGSRAIHDMFRVDKAGRGSYDSVVRGIRLLQRASIPVNVLSVANIGTSPNQVLDEIVGHLGVKTMDVLFPDVTHDDEYAAIADFYIDLFDEWFDYYVEDGVKIRLFEVLIDRLLGGSRSSDVLGPKNADVLTIHTDGELDVTDVVNTIPGWGLSLGTNPHLSQGIGHFRTAERYRRILHAAQTLPELCTRCPILQICGGGHLVSRWSSEREFDQPSVYCGDIQRLVNHVWCRVVPTLELGRPATS